MKKQFSSPTSLLQNTLALLKEGQMPELPYQVLTFTLFSVGGQLFSSLIIDLVSPTDGVHVSAYLVTGIVMTYLGVIAGGVGNLRVKKPQRQ